MQGYIGEEVTRMTKYAKLNITLICLMAAILFTGCLSTAPIKIGYAAALTGPNSEVGIGGRNAMQLLIDEVNAQGGINGRKLELIIMNDENDLEKVDEIDKTFIQQHVIAVVGHDMSFKLPVILEAIKDQPILMISPTMSDYSASGIDDNLLRIILTNFDQGVALAKFAVQHDGQPSIMAVMDLDNESFGQGLIKGFEYQYGISLKTVQIRGGIVDDTESIVSDFKNGGYEGLLMVLKSKDVAYLSQRIRDVVPNVYLYSSNWGMTQDVIALGGDGVEGDRFVSMIDFDRQTEDYVAFKQRYEDHYKVTPGFPAIYAYEAGQVLLDAIQKSSKLSAAALKSKILGEREFDTIQGVISFDEFGDVLRAAIIYVVEDGQFKKMD